MTRIAIVALAFCLTCLHVSADPAETPEAIYGHAMHGLLIGHDYERDIQQLAYITAKDPTNRKYHLALGCADADRAASLGYAALWTKTLAASHSSFPQDVKDWQDAQRDPASYKFGNPAPKPIPDITFPTKDDDYPFVMPLPKAEVRIKALVQSAQDEWKRALNLSQTTADRAEVEWTQGTGMALLRLLLIDNTTGQSVGPIIKDAKPLPTKAMSIAALTAATRDAPKNASYWQSLGDALCLQVDFKDTPDYAKALVAYNKSLALHPVNAPLWFRLYTINDDYHNRQLPLSTAALQHVIDSDPDNAYPMYLMANMLFHETKYNLVLGWGPRTDEDKVHHFTDDATQQKTAETALGLLETGNSASHYFAPIYAFPYPFALSGYDIWSNFTHAMDFPNGAAIRALGRDASAFGRIAAMRHDSADLERATRDAITMGLKLCGDLPTTVERGAVLSEINADTGIEIADTGYNSLVKGETDMGDAAAAQKAQAEYDAFKARTNGYSDTMLSNLLSPASIYANY